VVTYLDAICFSSSARNYLIRNWKTHPCHHPHRYAQACETPKIRDYNVVGGAATIRTASRSFDGAERCIEWCHDVVMGIALPTPGLFDSFRGCFRA